MTAKLLEIVLAAKSGALSGVLIVAGAVVTVTASGGVTTVALEDHPTATPTASLEVPAETAPEIVAEEEEEPADEPEERDVAGAPVAPKPEVSCTTGEAARAEARERVAAAFAAHRGGLHELRALHRNARAIETLENAETLLREIADKADRALTEMCDDVDMVADRSIAAMETVVNLARHGASVTPTPKPTEKPKATPKPTAKPKVTPKPTSKATPKPTRTPSCDDRLYANKLKMVAAYEKYHTLHDKLYYAVKRSANEATVKALLANDALIHSTYDSAKQQILSSGCGGDMGAAVATRAAATFEGAYQRSAALVGSQSR